jgi:hypothetical protein
MSLQVKIHVVQELCQKVKIILKDVRMALLLNSFPELLSQLKGMETFEVGYTELDLRLFILDLKLCPTG